jgi:allophanate hydrolase
MNAMDTRPNAPDSAGKGGSDLTGPDTAPFTVAGLEALYRSSQAKPTDVIRAVYERIRQAVRPDVWINLRPEAEAMAIAERLSKRSPAELRLYGIPFAVKDNIDVACLPTTAACPAYAYMPKESAVSVARLERAGAICIGKTNLDQFATGLCGVRSPYGACGSASHPDIISGGSSSGSAVAVGLGEVPFTLGTDTGGSGRIPASFNNVVGLKPTIGTISTRGLVPNCRSLDCVSVFAHTVEDAALVAELMREFDAQNPFSRRSPDGFAFSVPPAPPTFRFGVLRPDDVEFFGNQEAPHIYDAAVTRLQAMGGAIVPIDFELFREAGVFLFDGPWIAERAEAIGDFLQNNPDKVLPVTRGIVESAQRWSATDTFAALYRQQELKRDVEQIFSSIDVLAVPTVGTYFTIAEMEADPIARNTMMGFYSYFVNLLDLCAVAVPSGFYGNGLPAGITLIAPAFHDATCAAIASRFHQTRPGTVAQ